MCFILLFQYISGETKETGLEPLSRSSSVAPNPPSGVQSPEIVHQRIREGHKVKDMKEEPEELVQMHFRLIPFIAGFKLY
jgi:hypothetical protein